ncbi:MAG: hypothetical protein M5U07_12445, partial [Xanthobacteraceae bacterium]|nr:hypothetical protein [Xanthobacteraceae bacterium]
DRSVVFDVASPAGGTRVLTAAEIDGFVTMSGGLFASALTSEGRALVYELSADNTVLTAKAGSDVIFTVTLSDQGTGSFQFVLSGVLDHPVAATGASNEDVMGFTFRFAARDGDGDVATNDFTVRVIDDVGRFSPVRPGPTPSRRTTSTICSRSATTKTPPSARRSRRGPWSRWSAPGRTAAPSRSRARPACRRSPPRTVPSTITSTATC